MEKQPGLSGVTSVLQPWNVPSGLPDEHDARESLVNEARGRYIQDIVRMHSRLSFHGMAGQLQKNDALLYQANHGRGLVTLVAHTGQIPERYLIGLAGFRLAEYLQAGFASEELVFGRSLFCEPIREFHQDDTHVITIDEETGRILGYVALAHSKDPEPRPLTDPGRLLFPCEEVHSVRLQTALPDVQALETRHVREVKRLAHNHTVTARDLRLRITLELLAGITMAIHAERDSIRLLIGDLEEHIALKHLVLLGLDVYLLTGTTPKVSRQDLMHPRYFNAEKVLPFYSWIPPVEQVAQVGKQLEEAAAALSPIRALRGLMADLSGSVEHLSLPEGAAA
ncbi:hypothetical protein ACFWVU_28545 [Streptomyces sp. NPDC058686]|uniref:hypothetical protein n=1 Tax=Streptomyces sp. NPDC058686 TaxID=3346599 RepID=UPI0036472B97